jgi:F0F1-type ATP synthase membrane subunit b/b'
MTDINLAGLGLLSFLALFFPSTGLFHRRMRKVMERRAEAERRAAMQRLVYEEAERVVAETEKQYQQGLWR